MSDILEFLINFILAFGTGLAAIACLWDVTADRKFQAIPALVCFAVGYFRQSILWAASENGTLGIQQIVANGGIPGFFGSTAFKAILFIVTMFSCIFWIKFPWFKTFYQTKIIK